MAASEPRLGAQETGEKGSDHEGWSSHPSSEELGGQGRSGLKQDTQANKYLSCHSKKMEAALLSTLALYRVGKQGSLSSLKGGEAPDRVRTRSCLAGIHLPGS